MDAEDVKQGKANVFALLVYTIEESQSYLQGNKWQRSSFTMFTVNCRK